MTKPPNAVDAAPDTSDSRAPRPAPGATTDAGTGVIRSIEAGQAAPLRAPAASASPERPFRPFRLSALEAEEAERVNRRIAHGWDCFCCNV